uniref:Pre-mRNA splicing Prp18-interacting factor n=1 Tax=Tanacetum cinerariifolium TaxID=118510 RepID=A0A6L2K1X1_TANCI|nr:hypothetical protein [Tanacetum cinerariifolium]
MCINCTYGDGKPVTCCKCEGSLRGGFCLFCDLKVENSFTYDPNAYSFNDTSSNFNHLSQPQFENYLCELCGNNSHYGYDCQQQFSLVYEQEPSYNQNYNDNYYPYDSPSCLCCNNYGGLVQLFSVNQWTKILILPVLTKFKPTHAQPEDSNELFQKVLEDLHFINKELAEYNNSPSWDRPTFFNDNKDHFVQYKEYLENSSKEIAASNSNQEKEKPPQDSNIHQLIREECCIEVCKKQKQNVDNMMLELIEVCRQKELYCMHNNVNGLIESTLNSKLLSINLESQRGKIDVFTNVEDDDYFSFKFVIRIFLPYLIYHEVSLLLLSAESEDTIFDPGISV